MHNIRKVINAGGFSLLSTLIAVSIGAIITAAVWQLYSTVSSSGRQVQGKNLLTERSGMAILQLTDDIKASGSFGCFNARVVGGLATSLPNVVNTGDFRQFEKESGGLIAFGLPLRTIDNMALANESIVAGTDILKLQYGTNIAFVTANNPLTFIQPSYRLINDISAPLAIRYGLDISNSTINSVYVLASCSRLDQINGQIVGNTLVAGNGLLVNHDQSSARLMNFITKYYYIARVNGITGLYSKFLLPSGSMSVSQLVIPGAVRLFTEYEVETNNNRQIKSRPAMQTGDWININQVILTLQLQSAESSALGGVPLTESITQSILLR